MSKTIATYTLGCKVNQYETRAIEEMFEEKGYQVIPYEEKADVYIINTCTVTSLADRKSRQIIRKAKKQNKDALVVVCGCYSQNSPKDVADIEGVDLVLGTTDKNKITTYVEEAVLGETKVLIRDSFEDRGFEEISITDGGEHTRAFMKIQDGCDRFCSYCTIPYARGRVRSKKIENIIEEGKNLTENGYKEIVLTGIHLASYGKDLEEIGLIDVIEKLDKIEGIERIRLGSLEPTLITEDFMKRVTICPSFCENFHLSMQSGSNQTLKRMNRKYSKEDFMNSVELIRKYYSDPVITTDIIVGFPGETEEEFKETYDFTEKVKFYQTHIFKFSPREGTKAYHMKDQIESSTKNKRSEILRELCEKNKAYYDKKLIGKNVDILLEEEEDGMAYGHTKNFIKVYIDEKQVPYKDIVKAKVIELKEGKLIAKIT